VAIACPDDRSWQALAGAMGRPDLVADAGLATLPGRLERRRELDETVAAWTASRTAAEVQDCLQAVGVAAHELLDSAGCWADPQLHHRGHFQELSHPHHGTVRVQGPRLHFSRTVSSVSRAAPPLGEDTFDVLHELLGYDADHIAELAAAEVLE
jgi:benzylsuccinate CoA-transferase BbsF subunit